MSLVSAREAARRLESVGVGRRRTRRLLECGLAGPPTRAAGALLYDEGRVERLCSWPLLSLDQVDDMFPSGVFLARRYVTCEPSVGVADNRVEDWAARWALSPLTAIWIRYRIEKDGALPFVGASCGFITFGADITAVAADTPSTFGLTLSPPGSWLESLHEHRLVAPGGKNFMVRGWPHWPGASRGELTASSGARPSTAPAGSRAGR